MIKEVRTCIISKEKMNKYNLIRIVRTVENKVVIDYNYNISGRGAYLKKDAEIIKKAQKNNFLQRHLKVAIPEDLYQQLLKDL